jgi:hypothetical protein
VAVQKRTSAGVGLTPPSRTHKEAAALVRALCRAKAYDLNKQLQEVRRQRYEVETVAVRKLSPPLRLALTNVRKLRRKLKNLETYLEANGLGSEVTDGKVRRDPSARWAAIRARYAALETHLQAVERLKTIYLMAVMARTGGPEKLQDTLYRLRSALQDLDAPSDAAR